MAILSRHWLPSTCMVAILILLLIYTINNKVPDATDTNCITDLEQITRMRNSLSNELNSIRKRIGQMQCEVSKQYTNDQGGWCRNASIENFGLHRTDMKLIPELSQFLNNKRVAGFGDGPGAYKRELTNLGHVKSYDAYDGAPFCEETSDGRVKFMDLTIPQFGLPIYDWIISLEVAEHIPETYESIYLDNIFRHAKEGIILSWAVPGQGGIGHVNNKPLSYVQNVMSRNGFELDQKTSEHLRSVSTLSWLKRNINVYVRTNDAKFTSEQNLIQWFS